MQEGLELRSRKHDAELQTPGKVPACCSTLLPAGQRCKGHSSQVDARCKLEREKKSPQGFTAQPTQGSREESNSSTEIFLSNKGANLCYQKKMVACIFSFGDVTESSLILLLTSL